MSDVATVTDPDRPHLFRGKSAGYGAPVLPSLMGLPPDMHQEVAVSDARIGRCICGTTSGPTPTTKTK